MRNHAMRVLLSGCMLLTLMNCVPQRSVYRGQMGVGGYRVSEIEGCEYIIAGGGTDGSFSITHKGNCKNPVHRCN